MHGVTRFSNRTVPARPSLGHALVEPGPCQAGRLIWPSIQAALISDFYNWHISTHLKINWLSSAPLPERALLAVLVYNAGGESGDLKMTPRDDAGG